MSIRPFVLDQIVAVSNQTYEKLPPPPPGYIYYITKKTAQQTYYRCEQPIRKEIKEGMIHFYTSRLHLQNVAKLTDVLARQLFEIFEDDRIRASYGAPRDRNERERMFHDWIFRRELFVIERGETFVGFVFAGIIEGGERVEISFALHPSQIKIGGELPSSGQGLGEEAIHAIVNTHIPLIGVKQIIAFIQIGTRADGIVFKLGFSRTLEGVCTRAATPLFPYPLGGD